MRILKTLQTDPDKAIIFEVADDLQAMFFVFIWICILYIGPGGKQRPRPGDKKLLTYEWSEGAEGLSEDRVMLARRSKESFINSSSSPIDEQFTPYFDVLKEAAEEWRKLVREDEARAGSFEPQMTHKAIIDILSRALAQLPDRDPFLKRQLETTSIIASSSSSKKRRLTSQ